LAYRIWCNKSVTINAIYKRAQIAWRVLTLRVHPRVVDSWLTDALGGQATDSGVKVTEQSALTFSAVFSATRLLSESVGMLPLITYERTKKGKDRAVDHPVFRLLHDAPNEFMSSVVFRETLQGHLCGWGNAYAEIERNGSGEVVALWPLLPTRVKAQVKNGKLFYLVTSPQGGQHVLQPAQVLHIPAFGFDGIRGYSPIAMARQGIGLGLGAEKFAGKFFKNGAMVGGVLEHPDVIGPEASDELRKSLDALHKGLDNAHRMMILEEGMKYKPTTMPLVDAQFLEHRKFQVAEIARIFRVPPHMIGDLSKSSFSNIEMQSLEFVIFSLTSWLRRWEQELNRKLFITPQASKRFFVEFLVDGLLRGDITSRFAAYAIARQWGWMSVNDIRRAENKNAIPAGDIYLQPLNMVPAGTLVTKASVTSMRAILVDLEKEFENVDSTQ